MKHLILGIHLRKEDVIAEAEAIEAGEVILSAIAIPDDQPLADRDLLLRAAAVRETLLERATFIAARYGFAAASPADAAARCAPHSARWKSVLARYDGCVEMTLKVASAERQERPDRKDFTSGAEYLRALHASVKGATVDGRFREAVESELVPLCVRTVWTQRDGRSVELAALVRRERLDEVREAGGRLRATSVPFLLSGPWPLEVFADADHE